MMAYGSKPSIKSKAEASVQGSFRSLSSNDF